MTAATFGEYQDPGKFASAVLAVVVHLALFAFLYFGVQWHTEQPSEIASVELWEAPPAPKVQPSVVTPPVEQPPQPVIEPPLEPQPVQPVAKAEPPPEPKPVPKVEPKIEPKVDTKADIAFKQEKAKKKELEKKQHDEQLKKQHDEQLKEQQKRDELKREQTAERAQAQKERAEQVRREQLQQLANEEQAQRNAQRAAARNRASDEYVGKIQAKIRSYIVIPEGITGNPEAIFDVVQIPSGDIISAKLRKSSGNAAYDAAVERAILKSSPLPKPSDPSAFARDLQIKFRPQDH
jgi:colicin import membrane protein